LCWQWEPFFRRVELADHVNVNGAKLTSAVDLTKEVGNVVRRAA
jgi:hypothetical protein